MGGEVGHDPDGTGPNEHSTDDAKARFRTQQEALAEFATEFLVLVSPRGDLQAGAGAGLHVLGYDAEERRGHHIAEHIHPDDMVGVLDLIGRARVSTEGFHETIHVRAQHREGHWLTFEATIIPTYDHAVIPGSAVVRVRLLGDTGDVLDQTESAERFLSLAEAVPLGILSADPRGWVIYANASARQILDSSGAQVTGRGWLKPIVAADLGDVADAMGRVISSGSPQQATYRIHRRGEVRWLTARFVPLGDDENRTGWIATLDDVTDRREVESDLAHRATHDALTGLPNRTLLEDRLERAGARLQRDANHLSLLFIDLDDFKDINDTHGHHCGDAVLIEVARRLSTVLRPTDTVARLGGDEFVAVCEGLAEDEIEVVVGRVREAFAVPTLVGGKRLDVGASVGWASTSDADTDVQDLLVRADQAMYRAKRARRDHPEAGAAGA